MQVGNTFVWMLRETHFSVLVLDLESELFFGVCHKESRGWNRFDASPSRKAFIILGGEGSASSAMTASMTTPHYDAQVSVTFTIFCAHGPPMRDVG